MQKGLLTMDYGLWLITDPTGQITLTGWSETSTDDAAPDACAKIDHWPTYVLCTDRTHLPQRLQELDLDLAPGMDLSNLDKAWDVYLRHPDITALRAQLDRENAAPKR